MGKVGQTVERIGHLGMLQPQGLLPDGQGAPVEWLGLFILPLLGPEPSPDGF